MTTDRSPSPSKMKTLLICTDFSDAAIHAATYAQMFSRQFGIQYITLFHAWHTMTTPTALPVEELDEHQQANAAMDQLRRQKEDIESHDGSELLIRIRAEKMNLGENVNALCEEEKADMIVMGISNKTDFDRALMGSDATRVSQNSRYPVLIVPDAAPIRPVTRVLLALDFDQLEKNIIPQRLDDLLTVLNVPVTVLHAGQKKRNFSPQDENSVYQMHPFFEKHRPRFDFTDQRDSPRAISDYAEKNDFSLILSLPRSYNFFKKLMHKSTSQQLIYYSRVPILTLHE